MIHNFAIRHKQLEDFELDEFFKDGLLEEQVKRQLIAKEAGWADEDHGRANIRDTALLRGKLRREELKTVTQPFFKHRMMMY